MRPIWLSLYDGEKMADISERVEVTDLTQLSEIVLKHNWSEVLFTGNHRLLVSYEQGSCLVLDFDDGVSLVEAKEIFKNYSYLIATTKSHQKEKVTKGGIIKPAVDRFRMILFTDRDFKNHEEHKATLNSLLQKHPELKGEDGPLFDPCSYSAQRWTRSNRIEEIKDEGILLGVVGADKEEVESLPAVSTKIKKGILRRSTIEFLLFWNDRKSWHRSFYASAMDIRAQGYSFEEAKALLRKASPKFTLDENHDIPQLKRIYEDSRGEKFVYRDAKPKRTNIDDVLASWKKDLEGGEDV